MKQASAANKDSTNLRKRAQKAQAKKAVDAVRTCAWKRTGDIKRGLPRDRGGLVCCILHPPHAGSCQAGLPNLCRLRPSGSLVSPSVARKFRGVECAMACKNLWVFCSPFPLASVFCQTLPPNSLGALVVRGRFAGRPAARVPPTPASPVSLMRPQGPPSTYGAWKSLEKPVEAWGSLGKF